MTNGTRPSFIRSSWSGLYSCVPCYYNYCIFSPKAAYYSLIYCSQRGPGSHRGGTTAA